ncbi:MAG: Hsp20/alpha crystallin family protein [Desulforhopalus sp.]
MTIEQGLIKRPDSLPQKKYIQTTFWDLFLEILQQKGPTIELPDFCIPAIDVHDSNTAVTLEIEIPGMDAKDFTIRVNGDLINIRGEKKKIEPITEGEYSRRERRFGLFDRTIRLPAEVYDQNTTTMYEQGILKITLAKITNEGFQEMYNEEEPETTV